MVCQYAHKLAYLIGESVHDKPHEVNIFQIILLFKISRSFYQRLGFLPRLILESTPRPRKRRKIGCRRFQKSTISRFLRVF